MKNICIITDINGIYGFGHFTRMKFLVSKLQNKYNFVFSSINNNSEIFKQRDIKTCSFDKLNNSNIYLAIVDSREVDSKYIEYLKTFTSVIIIDSIGRERELADIVIEMLPNLDNSDEVNIEPFIATILNSNIKPKYHKNAPILVYLGFNDDIKSKCIEIISNIKEKEFIIIDIEKESKYSNVKYKSFSSDIFKTPYSAIITYFGLTAFECLDAKIPTILLSPTEYHNKLANIENDIFFNLGFYKEINIENAIKNLKNFLEDYNIQSKYLDNTIKIDTFKSIERFETIIENIKDFKNIKCPFCDSDNYIRINRNIESNLYRCNSCKTLFRKYFLPPFTDYSSRYFVENYKNQYGKTYEEDIDNLSKLARRRLDKLRQVKPKGKILDIGSAMGFFLNEAKKQGYETEGIEISKYAYDYSVNTLKLNVHNVSLLDFEYKEKEYDIITAWYVVEHIYNFEKVLDKILYSLKDDGILSFATPNGYGLSGRYNKNYRKIVPTDHAFETNPDALDKLLLKYNLKRLYLSNNSVYYNRFCDIFNLKYLKNNFILRPIYNKIAIKKNLGDTFECIYQKV